MGFGMFVDILNLVLNISAIVVFLILRDQLREVHYSLADSRRLLRLFELSVEDEHHNGLGRPVVEDAGSDRGG